MVKRHRFFDDIQSQHKHVFQLCEFLSPIIDSILLINVFFPPIFTYIAIVALNEPIKERCQDRVRFNTGFSYLLTLLLFVVCPAVSI